MKGMPANASISGYASISANIYGASPHLHLFLSFFIVLVLHVSKCLYRVSGLHRVLSDLKFSYCTGSSWHSLTLLISQAAGMTWVIGIMHVHFCFCSLCWCLLLSRQGSIRLFTCFLSRQWKQRWDKSCISKKTTRRQHAPDLQNLQSLLNVRKSNRCRRRTRSSFPSQLHLWGCNQVGGSCQKVCSIRDRDSVMRGCANYYPLSQRYGKGR